MPAPKTIAALAGEARSQFEYTERGEDTITVLRDDRETWVQQLAYAAHGDMMPDDWRFEKIADALEAIGGSDAETVDDLDDIGAEFADGCADVYTHDRLAWLSSRLDRSSYVDEARSEGLIGEDTDTIAQIGIGQYMEGREVFDSVARSLADRLDELEDGEQS